MPRLKIAGAGERKWGVRSVRATPVRLPEEFLRVFPFLDLDAAHHGGKLQTERLCERMADEEGRISIFRLDH